MSARSMRRILGNALVLLAVGLVAGDLRGQPSAVDQQDPRALFEQANTAFDEGQTEDAIRLYQSALNLVVPKEHPEILRNLVVSLRKVGRAGQAQVYADMLTAMGAEVPPEPAVPPAASPPEPPETPSNVEMEREAPPPPVQKAVSVFPMKGRSWTWQNLYRSRIGHWYGWIGKYAAYLVAVVVFVIGAIMLSEGTEEPGCLLIVAGILAAFLGGWLL